MSGGSLVMRIRMIDADTQERWLYNVQWEVVKKTLPSYERLYIMDDDYLDKIAIDLAVTCFFGNKCSFQRDTNIRDYIYGNITSNKRILRHVFIFFES